ncbi:MAG: hypothetical protein MUO67_16280 [Anaerolineales bacterium]|nr:hypothetical protein [Anaerolineales bacterium]
MQDFNFPIVQSLLASANPVIEYKTRVNLLVEPQDAAHIQHLRDQINDSSLARSLLSFRQLDGTIPTNPYKKWQGPLWTLVSLAQIDYPQGDKSLYPMRDQVYDWLLSDEHLKYPRSLCIPGQEDRFRRCAGQEAYAVWFTLILGIADERTDILVERLKSWQWPDGGWNCDKRPEAKISSFHETLMPLRALALYGNQRGDRAALEASDRAAEVFLKRRLYKRQSDGSIIDPSFTMLQYPYFYSYNFLFALVVMEESGFIQDDRCREALDLLASKQLPGGGFPLEKRIAKTTDEIIIRGTFADWGSVGKKKPNPFVTIDALSVLNSAGQLM